MLNFKQSILNTFITNAKKEIGSEPPSRKVLGHLKQPPKLSSTLK